MTARADDVDLEALPDAWRDPDALLLGPLVGELGGPFATALEAGCVGAIAQGYVRALDEDGRVSAREWPRPERDLLGVHVLFLSEHDLPEADARARGSSRPRADGRAHPRLARPHPRHPAGRPTTCPRCPGRRSTRRARATSSPPPSSCATRRRATRSRRRPSPPARRRAPSRASATTSLGDRAEVLRRMELRERMIETGEWEE